MYHHTIQFKEAKNEYSYHCNMYKLFGYDNYTQNAKIPRFQILGNGWVDFYTNTDVFSNTSVIECKYSEQIDACVDNFSLVYVPRHKNQYGKKVLYVNPTNDDLKKIKNKLEKFLCEQGLDVEEIDIKYETRRTIKNCKGKNSKLKSISYAISKIVLNKSCDISYLLENGYGAFKYNGLGYVKL
ncbi:MAG: hypothetical protein MJZ34_07260 [Paludibacteraceae bacterium]|nr:hypothetical protein [Paludibacteraceae bacterium]